MKINCKSICILPVLFIVFLSLSSCHKDGNTVKPMSIDTDTLTQQIYTINAGGTPGPGIILAAPFSSSVPASSSSPGLLLVMNQDGKVLREQTTEGSAFAFKQWKINGQTRYTYIVNEIGAFRAVGTNNNTGYAVIADSTLHELKRVDFIPNGAGPFQTGQELDVHDFILLSDNHYITMSYYPKNVSNIPAYLNPSPRVQVQVPLVQEINNGSVVWQWDASLDTSFYANSVEGNNYADSTVPLDYMHMNAMYVDPKDNNLVCSFRNQDQIIKISRQSGAILWRLGGKNSDFHLFSDQVFLRQHNPSLTDSNQTMLVFDNGDATLRAESRILEFKLDEVNKKVIDFKSFSIPEPFTAFMGSVQKMGEEYFIGGGTANYMLEINYVTGQKIMEFKGSKPTYRAYKIPSGNL